MRGIVVVKLGGRSVETAEGRAQLAARLAALARSGAALVVVHGGGAQVTAALAASGIEARFVDGLRVTDGKVMEVAEPVFAHVGKTLADALTRAGARAVALTGRDAHLVRATVKDPRLGRVGTVASVDAALLRALHDAGLVPVVGPVAVDDAGPLNVNADEVASGVARALRADELLLLTDVPAVRGADGKPIATLTPRAAEALIASGAATGGMIPKIRGALEALATGVARVRVLDEPGLT
ncbi:MAG TPA: acetylglutamate kinase, partial [Candidatus Thermoplasmatota archaeon]|nr:acetylglutamate kinase [Candidatus Thermoplasmatota archaeon]